MHLILRILHLSSIKRSTFLQHPNQFLKLNYCNSKKKTFNYKVSSVQHFYSQTISEHELKNDFIIFYKFPYIVPCILVNRLKVYQTAFTFFLVPMQFYSLHIGTSNIASSIAVLGVCSFASVMLIVMGHYFSRLIGSMYYNERKNLVRISHLSFFGTRKEAFMPIEDLVPLSDLGEKSSDLYVKLRKYSDLDFYLILCLRYGGIVNKKLFEEVFGNFN